MQNTGRLGLVHWDDPGDGTGREEEEGKTQWTEAHQASILHHYWMFAQVCVHCISEAIQPSHPLMPSSPSALNLS